MPTCPICNGKGHFPGMSGRYGYPPSTCRACNGSGKVPFGWKSTKKCWKCNGKGWYDGSMGFFQELLHGNNPQNKLNKHISCDICEGKGTVPNY